MPNDSKTYEALRKNNAASGYFNNCRILGNPASTRRAGLCRCYSLFSFLFSGFSYLKVLTNGGYVAATIISILLAWGRNLLPFTQFFMDVVPGYNKFRAVSMTLVIAEFCIPLLGFLALHAIITGKVAAEEAKKG